MPNRSKKKIVRVVEEVNTFLPETYILHGMRRDYLMVRKDMIEELRPILELIWPHA